MSSGLSGTSSTHRRFRVALSFPGEHRSFLEQVASCLSAKLTRDRVLYDKYYEAEFARPDLDTYLQRLYHDESDLIAVFLCADYQRKEWCGLEWRAIRDLIKRRQGSTVMPFRFDDTHIPGLFSIDGYISIDTRSPQDVAALILERLERNASSPAAVLPGPPPPPPLIAPSRLRHGADHLFGRAKELAALDAAWHNPATHILSIVAFGGVGKTALVVAWMARRAAAGWPGFDRVFDWSFYSQGAREQSTASADTFIAAALKFFGDEPMSQSSASPWDKGARLAHLIAQHRTLLVLDGLEPLQYPPGPLAGQLKDPALLTLLRGLAHHNPGLCILTTRETVADLAPYRDTTAPELTLENLSDHAGAALLHRAGANRTGPASIKPDDPELLAASREVAGHALTLRLLGNYLALTQHGDVRKRGTIRLQDAEREFKTSPTDAEKSYGHAFKMIAAYQNWLTSGGDDGTRQLAVLRLTGLFDRPASAGCIAALRKSPAIPSLTDPLIGLSDAQWNATLCRLASCGLISPVDTHPPGTLNPEPEIVLDSHPLVREYFALQVRDKSPDAWRAAHRRLYEYLKDSVEYQPDTLEGLQPLYQAIVHACHAGLHQDACDHIYRDRVMRKGQSFSTDQLGAFGVDLGAIACFFAHRWTNNEPTLDKFSQAWLLNQAGYRLRAIGRLTEAREPLRNALQMTISLKLWTRAGLVLRTLSALESALGNQSAAIDHAQQSLALGDRSLLTDGWIDSLVTLGHALHQAGRHADAHALFRKAETLAPNGMSEYPLLCALGGFRYCDYVLTAPEIAAWRLTLLPRTDFSNDPLVNTCLNAGNHATRNLAWYELSLDYPCRPLDTALDRLTLGKAALYRAILTDSKSENGEPVETARNELTTAVDTLRRAGRVDHLPRALLSRAWLRFIDGDPDGARADLDEAWEIAQRGPMRLHMADVLLHRARLFCRQKPYPWKSPHDDLAAAETLINDCGYHRRDAELADAQSAAHS